MKKIIQLTNTEISSGLDRVINAEALILQLPIEHDGRNTWLLNYGIGKEAILIRTNRDIRFDKITKAAYNTEQKEDADELIYISNKERISLQMDDAFSLGRKEKVAPIYDNRRIGNSTRLADYYIQELFTKGYVTIEDHFPHRKAHELLFKKVRRRLEIEHSGMIVSNSRVEFDTNKLTIKLKRI